MNSYPFFEVEKQVEQQSAILYLNRPEKLNAMKLAFLAGSALCCE